MKSWLIRRDPDAGKDWRQGEKGMTEGKMVGMGSLTEWTWVWASSGRWWRTGNPGVLQPTGPQRAGHDWVTEQHHSENRVHVSFPVSVKSSLTRRFLKAWCGGRMRNETHEFSERWGSGDQHHSKVRVQKLNPCQLYYTLSHEGKNVQGVKL